MAGPKHSFPDLILWLRTKGQLRPQSFSNYLRLAVPHLFLFSFLVYFFYILRCEEEVEAAAAQMALSSLFSSFSFILLLYILSFQKSTAQNATLHPSEGTCPSSISFSLSLSPSFLIHCCRSK